MNTIKKITPEIASRLLSNNPINRRIRPSHVAFLATIMANGEWVNGHPDPIVVAKSGRLLNGQHRLRAVVESGKTIQAFFIDNADESIMPYLDCGSPRTMSDRMPIIGNDWRNGLLIASLSLSLSIARGHRTKLSAADINKAWSLHSGHLDVIINAMPTRKRFVCIAPTTLAIGEYHAVNPEKAMEFLYSFWDPSSSFPSTRLLIEQNAQIGHGADHNRLIAYMRSVHACKVHLAGRKVTRLRACRWSEEVSDEES